MITLLYFRDELLIIQYQTLSSVSNYYIKDSVIIPQSRIYFSKLLYLINLLQWNDYSFLTSYSTCQTNATIYATRE